MRFEYLGLTEYTEALEVQYEKVKEVQASGEGVVLGCEHPAVITLGKRGSEAEDIHEPAAPIVMIDRGGHAVLHNPGQLVIYPIVPIKRLGISVRSFVDAMMSTTEKLLEEHGKVAKCLTGEPGLYTEAGKIAFFGIRVVSGVSMHGLAINVHNDLNLFDSIRSCGIEGERLDRIGSEPLDLADLFRSWMTHWPF